MCAAPGLKVRSHALHELRAQRLRRRHAERACYVTHLELDGRGEAASLEALHCENMASAQASIGHRRHAHERGLEPPSL